MRFRRNGEPANLTYLAVKDALSAYSTNYLESVVDVLGKQQIDGRKRDNGPAFMALAAQYLIVERYYEKVERIDSQLMAEVAKRMKICEKIGRWKKARGLPIHVPEREAAIIEKAEALATTRKLPPGVATSFFTEVMKHSRDLQARV